MRKKSSKKGITIELFLSAQTLNRIIDTPPFFPFLHGAAEEGANPSTQKVNMPHFSTYHGVTKMGFNKILFVRPTKIFDFLNFMY